MNRNEQRLIRTLVWFANLDIRSTRQVEQKFATATVPWRSSPLWTIPPEHVDAYRADAERLRGWLKQMIGFGKPEAGDQTAFVHEIESQVKKLVPVTFTFQVGKGFGWRPQPDMRGIEGAVVYGCAVILSDDMTRRRLGQCAKEGCANFFWDDRDRGGRAKAYCSTAHSDADRVSRWRRMKAAAHK